MIVTPSETMLTYYASSLCVEERQIPSKAKETFQLKEVKDVGNNVLVDINALRLKQNIPLMNWSQKLYEKAVVAASEKAMQDQMSGIVPSAEENPSGARGFVKSEKALSPQELASQIFQQISSQKRWQESLLNKKAKEAGIAVFEALLESSFRYYFEISTNSKDAN